MAETDSVTGLDLGIMAAYATIPNILAPDHEIGWRLHIINTGVKVWPGNGEPITEEVIENYQAAWVIEALDGIILRRQHSRSQNDQLMRNPVLDQTIQTIDSLFPDGITKTDLKFGRAIAKKWIDLVYTDEEWTEARGLKKLVKYVVKRAPHLTDQVEAKKAKACEVYNNRGTVKEEGIVVEELFDELEHMDILQEVPPPYVEVIDGRLVEPLVRDASDIVEASGVKSKEYDFPYYSTFIPENSKEILKNLLDDIVQLRQA